MPLDPELQPQLSETIYSTLQESVAKFSAQFAPQWNVRNDIARTLITVSSAVLVISISLSSHINAHNWILGICWVAFLCAIVSAVGSLYFCGGLFSLPAHILSSRKKLRKAVEEFDVTKPHEEADAIIDSLIADKLNHMEKIDRRAIRLLNASLLLFLIGVASTVVVGWLQLRT